MTNLQTALMKFLPKEVNETDLYDRGRNQYRKEVIEMLGKVRINTELIDDIFDKHFPTQDMCLEDTKKLYGRVWIAVNKALCYDKDIVVASSPEQILTKGE